MNYGRYVKTHARKLSRLLGAKRLPKQNGLLLCHSPGIELNVKMLSLVI